MCYISTHYLAAPVCLSSIMTRAGSCVSASGSSGCVFTQNTQPGLVHLKGPGPGGGSQEAMYGS